MKKNVYNLLKSKIKRIKGKTAKEITSGVLVRIFYIYPLVIISPLFSLFVLLIMVAISPFRRIQIGFLITERIGHLGINTDLFLRRKQLGEIDDFTYIFIAGKPCNRQLLDMWKRCLPIVESQLLYDLLSYSRRLWEMTPYFNPLRTFFNEYDEYKNTRPILSFTLREETYGRAQLREMGIDMDKDWYVCAYARDSEYLNSVYPNGIWSYHDCRDSDIDNLKLASMYIADMGGFVLRIGSIVSKPFEVSHRKVIDYASKYRSDFMDIYLMAHCKFVVGNLSGICDLSMIFDVPYLGINCIPACNVPHGKRGLFIPKKIRDRKTNNLVSFSKLIYENKNFLKEMWTSDWWSKNGYDLIENTEEEILDVVNEMMERLEGRFTLTDEEAGLLEKYFQLYPQDHWAKSIRTPIGIEFLKDNRKLFFN